MPSAKKQVVLFDAFGYELTLPSAPEGNSQAEIGRMPDRFSARIARDITPESLVAILRPMTPMQEHMALCDKLYVDAHFLSIASDRSSTASGLEWDISAFTDAPDTKPKPADLKVAELVATALRNASGLEQYFEHLAWGDGLYPFTGAETIWNPDTYMPSRFELPDATRFNWDPMTNSARLLTDANPREGEPLKPGCWTLHSANPTNPRKSRLYRALAFYYMVARFTIIDWLAFSEKYGKPIPVAYFEDPNDKPSLVEAVTNIGTEFAGVLPKSAKLEMIQALNATKDIQAGLAQFALDQSTKACCGHVLVVDPKPGAGTLAGNGAQLTNLKVAKGVAKRVAASVKQGLIRPLVWFHFGAKALDRLPALAFKTDPPEDAKTKADTYVSWNTALEPVGLAIDPEHIKDVSGIPTLVARPALGQPAAAGAPAGDAAAVAAAGGDPNAGIATQVALTGIAIKEIRDTLKDLAAGLIVKDAAIGIITGAGMTREEATAIVEATISGKPAVESAPAAAARPPAPDAPAPADATPPDDTAPPEDSATPPPPEKKPAEQKSRLRPAYQADAPKIRTLTDVIAASTLLGTKASQDQTRRIVQMAQEAVDSGMSLAEFRDNLMEQYDSFDHTTNAELTAQGMGVAEAISRVDEFERRAK